MVTLEKSERNPVSQTWQTNTKQKGYFKFHFSNTYSEAWTLLPRKIHLRSSYQNNSYIGTINTWIVKWLKL